MLIAILGAFFLQFAAHNVMAQSNSAPTHQEPQSVIAANHADVDENQQDKKGFDANKVIMAHIKDSHEWHFFTINGHAYSIPLPVILYVPQQGFSIFSSADFEETSMHDGFRLMDEKYIKKYKLSASTYFPGKIIAAHADGSPNLDVPVYDISLSKNVMQMLVASILLLWLFISIARRYSRNPHEAPTGMQNAIEPIVVFIRDEVAKPYLGDKYLKYLPYLLTVFFFIWINSLLGLIPGSANVPGNIAFTLVLAVITFVFILTSSNSHYWKHILWPPDVPILVKFILIPVEILGIFTKPFALMIRLFANMLAGHLIIVSIISMIFIFGALATAAGYGFSIVSILFTVFMYFLELLVGVIQAFIFTSLSALFIGQAFEVGHHEEDHGETVI